MALIVAAPTALALPTAEQLGFYVGEALGASAWGYLTERAQEFAYNQLQVVQATGAGHVQNTGNALVQQLRDRIRNRGQNQANEDRQADRANRHNQRRDYPRIQDTARPVVGADQGTRRPARKNGWSRTQTLFKKKGIKTYLEV